MILNKYEEAGFLVEDKDYELVTHADATDAWAVRILEGQFVETVILMGAVRFEDDHLNFNFEILETPDPIHVTEDNEDLQKHVGEILSAILLKGMDEGYIKGTDRETGEEIEFTD